MGEQGGYILPPATPLESVFPPKGGPWGPWANPPKSRLHTLAHGPWPPHRGRDTVARRLGRPPHGPPRVRFWLVLLVNLLIFWNMIACNLITLVLIILHVDVSYDWCFFSEVPRIEELQDPDSSPRREEVGRRTLRDYGGFLLPFFCRARFRLLTSRFS